MKPLKSIFLFTGICLLTMLKSYAQDWVFEYPGDDFTEDAMFDLRWLNENVAGENGFIGLSEDDNGFVLDNGEPVRFWPVNGGGNAKNFSDDELAHFARFLAKMGVNMIRFHGSINPPGKNTQIYQVDTAEVNAIWRMVAFMKKEGIYSTISPFWAHNGHMGGWVPEEWGIDGYSGKDALWEVMFFNDTLKNAYKHWIKYLYTETNTYTGIPLKVDPALAIIQVKNEDGVFFWTMQGIKPELRTLVGELFHDWLVNKYENIENAFAKWNDVNLPDDDLDNHILGIYDTWELTQNQTGGKANRIADQVAFFTDRQRNFYAEMDDYIKNELGCKQLTNGNNWKTADPKRLNDLERYTNTSCDLLAVNRYFDPIHVGENSGWRIDPGHTYVGPSALKNPHLLPVNLKQVSGHPIMVTESGWNLPHKYQAEGPFLIAAYQSLTGVDGFYWFNPSAPDYMEFPYFEFTRDDEGRLAMNRWTCSVPGQIGMFPANALAYRLGYIQQGSVVVDEKRSYKDMIYRKATDISEMASFDPNRDFRTTAENTNLKEDRLPLAFLAGTVKTTYATENSSLEVAKNLDKLINLRQKKIISTTGEIVLDYGKGICVVDAPKMQGVAGFLSEEGEFALSDVTIQSTNEYATVNVTALDQKNIDSSNKLLIQTGTLYRPTNWEETPAKIEMNGQSYDGYKIINTGEMPWLADVNKISVEINNSELQRAVALDAAGYTINDVEIILTKEAGKTVIRIPKDVMYVVVDSNPN